MAFIYHLFMMALLVQTNAAPSTTKLEDIATVTKYTSIEPTTLDEAIADDNTKQGDRKKRFYNYNGYGFPPMNPVIYPNNPSADFGEDPFQQIYRRLQSIATVVRNPSYNYNQLPPPPPFPILFPVIFIPQLVCNCAPQRPKPTQNGTDPNVDISNRFPEMEDERQNWGFVVNQNETNQDDGLPEDFTRPISFEPIRPNRTMARPPPAVDHGSNQEGREPMTTTTTRRPQPAPPSAAAPPPVPPTTCDAAILTCCHQVQVTYECFLAQNCPDPSSYGNPCDSQVILQVIDRYQRFYGQRSG